MQNCQMEFLNWLIWQKLGDLFITTPVSCLIFRIKFSRDHSGPESRNFKFCFFNENSSSKTYSETNAYLSFSYNAAEQEEEDGKWKFSSKNQVGPSIGGNVFIDSRAQTPDQIETDSKCFWFKHYGPKKNRKFRTVNCIYSPELFSFEGDGAVGVTFSKGPKSKLSFLSGVYAPTTLDTYDNAYAKVRDFNLKFSAGERLTIRLNHNLWWPSQNHHNPVNPSNSGRRWYLCSEKKPKMGVRWNSRHSYWWFHRLHWKWFRFFSW